MELFNSADSTADVQYLLPGRGDVLPLWVSAYVYRQPYQLIARYACWGIFSMQLRVQLAAAVPFPPLCFVLYVSAC